MIYRDCKIGPEFIGFSWAHSDNPGPDNNGSNKYTGRSTTIEGCQAQIDDLHADLDDQQNKFQLWAGTRT